jgi:hypothetical protein
MHGTKHIEFVYHSKRSSSCYRHGVSLWRGDLKVSRLVGRAAGCARCRLDHRSVVIVRCFVCRLRGLNEVCCCCWQRMICVITKYYQPPLNLYGIQYLNVAFVLLVASDRAACARAEGSESCAKKVCSDIGTFPKISKLVVGLVHIVHMTRMMTTTSIIGEAKR